MKIADSLEKVYTAMGGDEEFDKTSIANGIDQISEVASGGGGGGGIVFIDVDTETYALNASYNQLLSIVDGGAMPCVVVKTRQSVQIGYLFKLFESSTPSYRAEFMNIGGQSATPTIYKWAYEATDPDANMDKAEV